jgi:hypothetical protein
MCGRYAGAMSYFARELLQQSWTTGWFDFSASAATRD